MSSANELVYDNYNFLQSGSAQLNDRPIASSRFAVALARWQISRITLRCVKRQAVLVWCLHLTPSMTSSHAVLNVVVTQPDSTRRGNRLLNRLESPC